MLYATISRGFRSGTPNLYSVLDSGPPIVKPDYVWTEEDGAQLSWFNGHLTPTVSAYRIDWLAVPSTVVRPSTSCTTSHACAPSTNAAHCGALWTTAHSA